MLRNTSFQHQYNKWFREMLTEMLHQLDFLSLRKCFSKRSKTPSPPQGLPTKNLPEDGNITIVIAHGAFHQTWHYEPFRNSLLQHPQISRVQIPQQSSAGTSPPLDCYARDVVLLHDTISAELEAGQDVLLLCHSYGGIPGCDALADLPEKSIGIKPLGRILGIVFVSAFVAEEGQSLITSKMAGRADWVSIDGALCHVLNPSTTLYNQVQPPSHVEQCVAHLLPQASSSFMAEVQYAPWKEDRFPVAYVRCFKDQAMRIAEQEFFASRLSRLRRSPAHALYV